MRGGGARRGGTRRRTRRRTQRRRRRRRVLIGGAMVVGAGALAYKLGKNQTKQVEQASGKPIDEMTDEEIQKYVKENNIETEPLDESDQAYLKADEAQPEKGSYLDELERLAKFRDEGIITEEEYEAKKKELLNQ